MSGNVKCNRPDIKVACILDTFSYHCFRHECALKQLARTTWKKQMRRFRPHFLFVESAWVGVNGSWRGHLVEIEKKAYSEIRRLIQYCLRKKIPTVFWNKEDPPHYDRFIATAQLFNYVFTTDENCLERYKHDLDSDRVAVLPFAAQPVLHNPINTDNTPKRGVAFAGTWYNNRHLQRKTDLQILLAPAQECNLQIFDRKYQRKQPQQFRFPRRFQPNIRGRLDYLEMSKTYKRKKVFLNVNTVKESSTMFSRRVFEILASGTNVISTYAKGIEDMFPNIIPISYTEEETRHYLTRLLQDSEYSQRLGLLGMREVYSKHLYQHRFNQILETIGLAVETSRGVSVIVCVNPSQWDEQIFRHYVMQAWEQKELIVVCQGAEDLTDRRLRQMNTIPGLSLFYLPESATYMDCINFAIKQAQFDYLSFFQADAYYAPHFLTDLMHAFYYSDADIVGKRSHFIYVKHQGILLNKFPSQENRFVQKLHWSAMIAKKKVFKEVELAGTIDEPSIFAKCVSKGMKMYATDKYNYASIQKLISDSLRYRCLFIDVTGDFTSIVTV